MAELAVSITLVNEQMPAQRRRGFLYSIVQGGWPIGVFLASGVYLLVSGAGLGWRWVYVVGVVPADHRGVIARRKVRESGRFEHMRDRAPRPSPRGDQHEVDRLVAEHDRSTSSSSRRARSARCWSPPARCAPPSCG